MMRGQRIACGMQVSWEEDGERVVTRKIIPTDEFRRRVYAATHQDVGGSAYQQVNKVYKEYMPETAPMAVALVGHLPGDCLEVPVPSGVRRVRIL